MIRRSDGVLVGELGNQVVACDTVRHRAHIVDGLLAWLLLLDDPTPFEELVGDLVTMTRADEATSREDLQKAVGLGASLHLLGRFGAAPNRAPLSRLEPTNNEWCRSRTNPVLDEAVAFCCSDRTLIAQIDEILENSSTNADPTQWISVSETRSGEVLVDGEEPVLFDTRTIFLSKLGSILNQVATRSRRVIAVSAGAVRTPAGDVLLLPSSDGCGDGKLIGALIQAGCDYLGSEVIGIGGDATGAVGVVGNPTPLRLDADSLAILGLGPSDSVFTRASELRSSAQSLHGEHRPIGGVLFCEVSPEEPASAIRLDPADAVESLLTHGLNLASAPHFSIQPICDLAANIPNFRIRHHDAAAFARVLVTNESWQSLDDLDRQIRIQRRLLPAPVSQGASRRDQLEVRRSPDVASHDAMVDGERTTFVIDRTGKTAWALTGLQRRIWDAAAAECVLPMMELAKSEADRLGGSDEHSSKVVARALSSIIKQGLLVQVGPGPRLRLGVVSEGASLDDVAQDLRRYGEPRSLAPHVEASEPWRDLLSEGDAFDWLGHLLVTDVESVRRILVNIGGTRSGVARSSAVANRALIEVRSAPGPKGMILIRLNGGRLWWVSEDDALAVLGVLLANLAVDRASLGQSLAEVSASISDDRCLLHIGVRSSADQDLADELGLGRRARFFGARVEDGKKVLLPENARAASWLTNGADPGDAIDVWRVYSLAGVLVEGARDLVGGWLQALTELSPFQPVSGRFLSELLASGDVPLAVAPRGEPSSGMVERLLVQDENWERVQPNKSTTSRAGRNMVDASSPNAVMQSAAWTWATRLGKVSWSEESAKISRGRLVLGRGLLRIRLSGSAEGEYDRSAAMLVASVTEATTDLGLDVETSAEIAQASVAARNLYLGTELAAGCLRRKLYVRGIGDSVWANISRRWPRILTEDAATPSWISWKWLEDQPAELERSIYQGHLGHAPTVGQQVDTILDMMGSDWSDVVQHVLAQLGIEQGSVPAEGDLLTLDEGGRCSVDLSRVGSGWQRWRDIEAEIRWIAAVADLSKDASEDLVAWSHGSLLSRLIFGTDRNNEPFVNLYVAKAQQQ